MKNPFKFGSVVEGDNFTNRIDEIEKIKSILQSDNHLIIISPRRYGKTSLINKIVNELNRPTINFDLQLVTTVEDLSSQLLKRIYRIYPFEKIKRLLKDFKILPNISLNPISNEVDISFSLDSNEEVILEDIFNLINKLATKKNRPIIVIDEFQEIKKIEINLDKKLRSLIQYHKNISYVFLGSQESIIRDLFEKKNSPFYHFGYLFSLQKIPRMEFFAFLEKRFKKITANNREIAEKLLNITNSHPYYTKHLAFSVWEIIFRDKKNKHPIDDALSEIIRTHDIDYERLWNTFNRTDMKVLIGMASTNISPLSEKFTRKQFSGASSTVFSSLKRLEKSGYVIKTDNGYEIDDPFFKRWIIIRRER